VNIEFFIAKRIIKGRSKKKRISRPTVRIAITGVTMGLTVMILTLGIVSGFQRSIKDKVEGFNSDIQITSFDNNNSNQPTPISRNQPFLGALKAMPGITHVQAYAVSPGIIRTKTYNEGVLLKGVGSDYDWSFVQKNMLKGQVFTIHDSAPSTEIVISKTIASALEVDTGSQLHVFFVTRSKDSDAHGHYGVEQRVRTFHVKGIYSTGLEEFDRQMVFVDMGQVQNLNYWSKDQIGGFELHCADFDNVDKIEDNVNSIIGQNLNAQSIKKLNSSIFSWLELQNTNAAIIIILMAIVSAIAMVSALIVLILENTNMIGLLKALGSRNLSIQKIFLIDGAYLIAWGMLLGNIVGLSFCIIQAKYGLIKLSQETYYVPTVPVHLNWEYVILLNAACFVACMATLIFPSLIISRIQPVRTLKYS
jgi:lipoprotein-releasing system permease protein